MISLYLGGDDKKLWKSFHSVNLPYLEERFEIFENP